jgi:hypothetical protein
VTDHNFPGCISGIDNRRDLEREGQAWIVLACLDRIDRLPGNVRPIGKLGLGSSPLGPQDPQHVLHRYRAVTSRELIAQPNDRGTIAQVIDISGAP